MIGKAAEFEIQHASLIREARQLLISLAEERLTKSQRAPLHRSLEKVIDDINLLLVMTGRELASLREKVYPAERNEPLLCAN
jgi:hypothetical protein